MEFIFIDYFFWNFNINKIYDGTYISNEVIKKILF